MIRRHLMALRLGLMLIDGMSAVVVFLIVSYLRFGGRSAADLWEGLGLDIRVAAAAFALAWVTTLWYLGLYALRARWRLRTEATDIGKATVLVVAVTLSVLFLFKLDDVSRLFLALLFVAQPLVTLVGRALLRWWFASVRRRGYDRRFMVIVGTGELAERFANEVASHPELGVRIVGHLAVPGETSVVSRAVLGSVTEIEDVFHTVIVDEVAVCLPPTAAHYLEPIAGLAAGEGKTVRIPLDPVEELMPNAHREEFGGLLVRSLVHDGHREVGLIVKRLIDIAGAVLGLVVLSPIFAITAVWIAVRDGGPILFRQTRIGLHGRPFTIYKFRTMVRDAEARLGEVRHLNERGGVTFKATDDPRITPWGRWLRKTSIDELPQLWNVLTGTMSLVGPRPPLPSEVTEYNIWHRRRLSMKPGITGLWQVDARDEPDFDRWVERDLVYIDGWSIWLDLKILLRTLPAVFAREGR
jgi:exopolysaccharide biosynthesis polyprenyl glycosylphosphotransferase